MSDIVERLRAYNSKITSETANEIERLREVKRRALQVADERSK